MARFIDGKPPVILFVEIEPNVQLTPRELPKFLEIQKIKYNLFGLICFYNNSTNPRLNHFIFKLFDGLNFFDIDNLRTKIPTSFNNELFYNGKFFVINTAFYILNDF